MKFLTHDGLLYFWNKVKTKLDNKADVGHSHTTSDITNFPTSLPANGGTSSSCTGNAATATKLQTARTINGVSFNGSANITITAAANGGTSSACSGNSATATTATKWNGKTLWVGAKSSLPATKDANTIYFAY